MNVARSGRHKPLEGDPIAPVGPQRRHGQLVHRVSLPDGNQIVRTDDWKGMECQDARVLASTELDDQLSVGEHEALEAHLATCDSCSAWTARLTDVGRRSDMSVVEESKSSLSTSVRHARRNRGIRFALGWAGMLLIVWHLPDVVTAGSEAAVHLGRHQAGFAVALGVGFVVVALRPDRAYGMLPFVVAFAVVLTAVALIDLVSGASSLVVEARHLLELGGLVMMWVLAAEMGPGRRRAGISGSPPEPGPSPWSRRRNRR